MSWLKAFVGIAWVCALGWLAFVGVVLHGLIRRKPLVSTQDSGILTDAPLVSILLPARNEARRVLTQSVRSALAQDYDPLEVIAVNDRSTDATESILFSIAETARRLRVINGVEPPKGWLGKPHALQQALEVARGDWVLTMDADMLLEKEAVRIALEHALAGGYDVLTLMPHFEAVSFWERVFTPAWLLALLGGYPLAILNHPKLKHALAFGGFSLIRRRALARIGDFAAVRADIVEDIRLAELLKKSGARYRIEHAPNLVRTRMQSGLREIWDFLSRGMFAGMRYSFILSALAVLVGYAFVVAPVLVAALSLLMLAAGGATAQWLSVLAPTLIIWAIQVLALMFICKKFAIPQVYALTTPLGLSLIYTALLISTLNIMRGKGVAWKERSVYQRSGVELPTHTKRTADSSVAGE